MAPEKCVRVACVLKSVRMFSSENKRRKGKERKKNEDNEQDRAALPVFRVPWLPYFVFCSLRALCSLSDPTNHPLTHPLLQTSPRPGMAQQVSANFGLWGLALCIGFLLFTGAWFSIPPYLSLARSLTSAHSPSARGMACADRCRRTLGCGGSRSASVRSSGLSCTTAWGSSSPRPSG